MESIIEEALSVSKKVVDFNRKNFRQSAKGYRRLEKRERMKTMLKSAINRIKMDWIYFRWNGWSKTINRSIVAKNQ